MTMRTQIMRSSSRGFSLLELAVVLAVIGAVGLLLWQFMPRIKSLPAFSHTSAPVLSQAEDALNGFILAKGRLPCPDTDGSGTEDCSGSAFMGSLPVKTLGLSLSEPVRYGVYRSANAVPANDADLAMAVNRYVPLLPTGFTTSALPNGLDFCAGLLNIVPKPEAVPAQVLTALTAGTVPIAYGLATAGPSDADGNGNRYDGANTGATTFEPAGTPQSAIYNDDTRTVGAGELFARLGCATQLANINGTARAMYAAYDIDRFADLYKRFRDFQITVRQSNKKMVEVSLALAIADLANAIGTSANAIALVYETFGAYTPVALAATLSIGAAVANVAAQGVALEAANDKLALAQQQAAAAGNLKAQTLADRTAAMARVTAAETKGLLP